MATSLLSDLFDSSNYPRTYRASLGWKLLLVPIGVLFGLAGIAGIAFALWSLMHDRSAQILAMVLLAAICAAFACLGVYTALSVLTYRVTLRVDGIEVIEPFRRRRLLRRDIRGRHTLSTQPPILVLVPNDAKAKKLKVSLMLDTDRAFDDWCGRVTDLDRKELRESEQELEAALYQEVMPEERARRIERLRVLANWANGATIALSIAALALPDQQHILTAALIAVPWIAILMVAQNRPLYRFGAKRNDAHPDLTLLLIVPGLLLMARVLSEVHTLGWKGPVTLACAGGLALSTAALRVDPWFREQRWTALLMGLFTCAYGYGAGLEINVLADPTVASIYPTQVLGKDVSSGSRSTTWYLRVAPWGPVTGAEKVSVSAAQYQAARTGDTVCMYLGAGAFRVVWYQVRDCPRGLAVPGAPRRSF
jgi:hypothetical protein